MKTKKGMYNSKQVAEVLKVNRSSVGDLYRVGAIPAPVNDNQKKHWYWLQGPIDDTAKEWGVNKTVVDGNHEEMMHMWTIEKDVPCPWNPEQLEPLVMGGRLCPFEAMNAGESFYIEGKRYNEVSEFCYKQARNNLMMIYIRSDPKGVRIWRLL